jgi:thiosulfate dehydrogenase [quinone] large subunit
MSASANGFQQITLVLLRTLIGWHFAWEGFVKLFRPSWSRGGWPLPAWSATGYLEGATGPLADFFHRIAQSSWMGVVDIFIAVLLLLTGLSMMLGLFTRTGTLTAFALLVLFYVLYIPTAGVMVAGTEGNYLFVNKNLVEAAAVLVLVAFDTGRFAGLDLLIVGRRRQDAAAAEPAASPTEASS